jgi:N-acetyl-anhydromuramyl-L-alanine amidase AmpD
MPVAAPPLVNKLLPGKAGRGRPNRLKPVLLVMHIQEGTNDLAEYFKNVDADCTIWNPPADNDKLVRLMNDEDTIWTNGAWTEPINHANPVIEDLFKRGIKTNDIALTIEHAGFHDKAITDAQLDRSAQICAYWCDRWGIPPDRNHIIGHYEVGPHKQCPGPFYPFDRLVAKVRLLMGVDTPQKPTIQNIPMNYTVIIPNFKATVRKGPGRGYDIVTTLDASRDRRYQVTAEAHGELIGSDDVWCFIPEVKGYITRTAITIVH